MEDEEVAGFAARCEVQNPVPMCVAENCALCRGRGVASLRASPL